MMAVMAASSQLQVTGTGLPEIGGTPLVYLGKIAYLFSDKNRHDDRWF